MEKEIKIEGLQNELNNLNHSYDVINLEHRLLSKNFLEIQEQLDIANEKRFAILKKINHTKATISIIKSFDSTIEFDDLTQTFLKIDNFIFVKICGFKSESFKSTMQIERISSDAAFKNIQMKKECINMNSLIDIFKNAQRITEEEYNEHKTKLLKFFN
jgi:hypothetical protein